MKGKTVVITGGTSGIGEIAADRLAQMGARIVLIARSKSRGKVTLARLHEKAPDLAHTVHYADLTRITEMKRVAAEIAHKEPRIDVLINNAGAMFANRRLTEDRLECTFALNHMAYFVITEGLRPRIREPNSISTICNWPKDPECVIGQDIAVRVLLMFAGRALWNIGITRSALQNQAARFFS
jgi:NAD(P)-dependent dehydrogenase (short-subunit alcohol dehydrogenase family)